MASDDKKVLKNGAKVLGEVILPGSSLMMEEKVPLGLTHTAVAAAAGLALGPLAVPFVAANSLSLSITGRNLASLVTDRGSKDPRDESLVDRVERDIEGGASVEEIRDDVLEDVEDLYAEASARKETA